MPLKTVRPDLDTTNSFGSVSLHIEWKSQHNYYVPTNAAGILLVAAKVIAFLCLIYLAGDLIAFISDELNDNPQIVQRVNTY